MLLSAREADVIAFGKMTDRQVAHCVIRDITRFKLYPALAVIRWLRKKEKPVPRFDYPEDSLLASQPGKLGPLFILKYRLCMWVRQGRQRVFLREHPWVLEKVGHFLYRFPASVPGFLLVIKTGKIVKNLAGRLGLK